MRVLLRMPWARRWRSALTCAAVHGCFRPKWTPRSRACCIPSRCRSARRADLKRRKCSKQVKQEPAGRSAGIATLVHHDQMHPVPSQARGNLPPMPGRASAPSQAGHHSHLPFPPILQAVHHAGAVGSAPAGVRLEEFGAVPPRLHLAIESLSHRPHACRADECHSLILVLHPVCNDLTIRSCPRAWHTARGTVQQGYVLPRACGARPASAETQHHASTAAHPGGRRKRRPVGATALYRRCASGVLCALSDGQGHPRALPHHHRAPLLSSPAWLLQGSPAVVRLRPPRSHGGWAVPTETGLPRRAMP